MIQGVGQLSVPTEDLDRSIDFYRDVLGLTFLFRTGGMAFLQAGPVRLMLALPEDGELTPPGSIVYYRVESIHDAHRSLLERGVGFEREPARVAELEDHELWLAFFRDPDGNLAALMSEVPTDG